MGNIIKFLYSQAVPSDTNVIWYNGINYYKYNEGTSNWDLLQDGEVVNLKRESYSYTIEIPYRNIKRYREIVFSPNQPVDKNVIWFNGKFLHINFNGVWEIIGSQVHDIEKFIDEALKNIDTTINSQLDNYYTKQEVDTKLESVSIDENQVIDLFNKEFLKNTVVLFQLEEDISHVSDFREHNIALFNSGEFYKVLLFSSGSTTPKIYTRGSVYSNFYYQEYNNVYEVSFSLLEDDDQLINMISTLKYKLIYPSDYDKIKNTIVLKPSVETSEDYELEIPNATIAEGIYDGSIYVDKFIIQDEEGNVTKILYNSSTSSRRNKFSVYRIVDDTLELYTLGIVYTYGADTMYFSQTAIGRLDLSGSNVNLSNYYNKTESDDRFFTSEEVSNLLTTTLADYATNESVNTGINAIFDTIGNATLETNSQTLTGAINELNSALPSKETVVGNNFTLERNKFLQIVYEAPLTFVVPPIIDPTITDTENIHYYGRIIVPTNQTNPSITFSGDIIWDITPTFNTEGGYVYEFDILDGYGVMRYFKLP